MGVPAAQGMGWAQGRPRWGALAALVTRKLPTPNNGLGQTLPALGSARSRAPWVCCALPALQGGFWKGDNVPRNESCL